MTVLTLLDRGYTGHEHLQGVCLVHMNGRLYDAKLHRFLQPDNFVQDPSNTQNFNRYGYVLNNPLKYTDPSGEFLSLVIGLFETVANVFTHGVNFNNYDWDKTINAFKIDLGLFKADGDKTFFGQVWQVFSRFTLEALQTTIGYGYSHFINVAGKVDNVQFYGGATVLKTFGDSVPYAESTVNGVTFGSYIIGNNTIEAEPSNSLFQHEYGHYLQSQKYGFAYFPRYGIQSVRGYDDVEYDANSRAFSYFHKKTGGNFTWHFEDHTLNDRINWNLRGDFYNNPDFQLALTGSLVKPKWYNYIFIP